MFERPLYQTSVAVLSLVALAAGLWLLVAPEGSPGVEIVAPSGPTVPARAGAGEPPTSAEADLIDINSAPAAELDEALPGIGPALSQRIVDYREENGPFVRTDQLMGVSGIGPGIFDGLRTLVTVAE